MTTPTTTSIAQPVVETSAGKRHSFQGSTARTSKPFRWFAAIGSGALLVQAYVYSRWIFSGNATPTSRGPDPIPSFMVFACYALQILAVVLWVLAAYHFIVRPWRRERKLPLVGRLMFVMLTCEWQDLIANYFNHIYTFNAAMINFGSWYSYIPGWSSPRGSRLAEGFALALPLWSVAILLPALALADLMRRSKLRWPNLGKVGLLSIALGVAAGFDLILESLFARVGVYVFAGSIPSLTFFSGHYYQFPLYEAPMMGALIASFAGLLYFRDDRGRTVAERAIDDTALSARSQSILSFLSLVGFANMAVFVYGFFFAITSLMPSFAWAPDVVNRSYFRNELCGAGTTYACPGADVPIPRRGGAHLDPEGRVVSAD